MALQCPVIAVSSGGPKETILDGVTGFLCLPDPADFANKMHELLKDSNMRNALGINGRERVQEHFTLPRMSTKLQVALVGLTKPSAVNMLGPRSSWFHVALVLVLVWSFAVLYNGYVWFIRLGK